MKRISYAHLGSYLSFMNVYSKVHTSTYHSPSCQTAATSTPPPLNLELSVILYCAEMILKMFSDSSPPALHLYFPSYGKHIQVKYPLSKMLSIRRFSDFGIFAIYQMRYWVGLKAKHNSFMFHIQLIHIA